MTAPVPSKPRLSPGAVLAAAAVAAVAVSCDRTKTLEFQLQPGDGTCGCDLDVSCLTHVRITFEDADGNPMGASQCRGPIDPKLRTLCSFGAEIGSLPALPTGQPFRLHLVGFSQTPRSAGPCAPGDVVFDSRSELQELGGATPDVIGVPVSSCQSARCGGVSGTVTDLQTSAVVTDGVSVQFGYATIDRFQPTSVAAAPDAMTGRFDLLSSDYSRYDTETSMLGCWGYMVTRGLAGGQVSCRGVLETNPKIILPIAGDSVPSVPKEVLDKVETLLESLVAGGGGHGGYVLGRVVGSNGVPVEGAVVTMPGTCQGPPGILAADCVWYPDQNLASFRGSRTTDKSGLFVSAFRDISPTKTWTARVETDASRLFGEAKAFFLPGHVCLIQIVERGT